MGGIQRGAGEPAESDAASHPVSRRSFLGIPLVLVTVSGGGVAAGAAIGAGLALGTGGHRPHPASRDRSRADTGVPPSAAPTTSPHSAGVGTVAALRAAVDAEQTLIADLAASATPLAGVVLDIVSRDHVAHLAALRDAARHAGVSLPGRSAPAGRRRALPELASAETAAALAAGRGAAAADGASAVLLASISACEAGHAALLR